MADVDTSVIYLCLFIHSFIHAPFLVCQNTVILILSFLHHRAQDRHGGPGQRGQDHHSVPAADERGGPHVTHHRQQRRGGGVEEPTLHYVGLGRPGVPQISLEHLLHQHRGEEGRQGATGVLLGGDFVLFIFFISSSFFFNFAFFILFFYAHIQLIYVVSFPSPPSLSLSPFMYQFLHPFPRHPVHIIVFYHIFKPALVVFHHILLLPQFVILVIDSTDRERLSITREELYKMLAHEELSRAAVLIYANKQDVKGSMSAAEISRLLNLTSIKKHRWQIQGCCALTGEGYVS